MSSVFLVVGSTGAGKSTYSRVLAEKHSCPRFSVDEWMKNLFLPDQKDPMDYQWNLERTERVEKQILHLLSQFKSISLGAVLDLGFFQKSHRMRVRSALKAMGLEVRVHYLDVSAEERWNRVEKRNREKGETFSLLVTREMFDFCEGLFEVPGAEELVGGEVVR